MSRGAQRTTRQLTDQQLTLQNQLISQANQQGAYDRSLLLPTISGLLNSQGFTPAQQSAITQQSMGALNTAFDALRERAANRAAATNDTAAAPELTAELGREQAQGAGRPGAAESDRLRQPPAAGAARGAQRAGANLRHRHQSPRARHGHSPRAAGRAPARVDGLVDGRLGRAVRPGRRRRFAVRLAAGGVLARTIVSALLRACAARNARTREGLRPLDSCVPELSC